jgi:hypothetical protein
MNMPRKEVADYLSKLLNQRVSVYMVSSNEVRWGLFAARINLNSRVVFYDRAKVESACKKFFQLSTVEG